MHRRLFKTVEGQKRLLSKLEVAEFDQREVDAVARRRNQVVEPTLQDQLDALTTELAEFRAERA